MEYGKRTMRNFNTVIAGLTVTELMGPNPYRCALVFSPVANQLLGSPSLGAAVFAAGANQIWTVPTGVTVIADGFAWGSGGNSGASGAVLGGGGGGGGGFSTMGSNAVYPGQLISVNVDSAGNGGTSGISNLVAAVACSASSGVTAVLDAAGAGGGAGSGSTAQGGGNGAAATALAGVGGGSGSAGGFGANGNNAAGATGGAAAGTAQLNGYGVGGAGKNGQAIGVNGLTGGSPGAGGSGGGKTGGLVGAGADGQAIIFYPLPAESLAISIDQDPNLVLLRGAFNFLPGRPYPVILTADDIGDAIMEPWYVISGVAAQVVRVTEYSYVP